MSLSLFVLILTVSSRGKSEGKVRNKSSSSSFMLLALGQVHVGTYIHKSVASLATLAWMTIESDFFAPIQV